MLKKFVDTHHVSIVFANGEGCDPPPPPPPTPPLVLSNAKGAKLF